MASKPAFGSPRRRGSTSPRSQDTARTRRGRPLTSQAIAVLLRNQLYAGIVDVTEYGIRGKRGDFEPLISEDLFYRVQAVFSGPAAESRLRSSERIRTSRCAPSCAATSCGRQPHRQLVEGGVALYGSKCRLAKARPEPDFR